MHRLLLRHSRDFAFEVLVRHQDEKTFRWAVAGRRPNTATAKDRPEAWVVETFQPWPHPTIAS